MPFLLGADDHAGVLGDVLLQAGGDERRLGDQQRHRLPLHVGAHQRAVGVVVLEERDQPGRDADHLLGRDVDVLRPCRPATSSKSPPIAGDDAVLA